MRGWARLGAWGGPSRCVALRAWFDTLTTNGSECTTNGRRAGNGRGRRGRGCGAAWWGTRARGSRLPLKGSRDPRARDVAIFWAAGWRDAEAGERVPEGRAGWGGFVVRLGPSPTAARLTTNGRQRVRKGKSADRNRAKRAAGIGTSGCKIYSDSVRYPEARGKGRGAVASGRWSVVSEEGVGHGEGLGDRGAWLGTRAKRRRGRRMLAMTTMPAMQSVHALPAVPAMLAMHATLAGTGAVVGG